MAFQSGRQLHKYLQIKPHALRNARPLDLHENLRSILQFRKMALRHGGRSDGMFVEFGKHIFQFTTEFCSDLLANKIHTKRRHIVLQFAELMHEFRRNHILPLGKDLA